MDETNAKRDQIRISNNILQDHDQNYHLEQYNFFPVFFFLKKVTEKTLKSIFPAGINN